MPSDDRSTVEQALATFLDAFSNLDRPRVEACFTDDATAINAWVAGARTASGVTSSTPGARRDPARRTCTSMRLRGCGSSSSDVTSRW